MLEKAGIVFDERIDEAQDDLINYFQKNPKLLGLDSLKQIRNSFFQQNDYHGVIFTIIFDDDSEAIVLEKTLLVTFKNIHNKTFDHIYTVPATEILYLIVLNK